MLHLETLLLKHHLKDRPRDCLLITHPSGTKENKKKYISPLKLIREGEDEMEEEITEKAKSFIDIASDSQVLSSSDQIGLSAACLPAFLSCHAMSD